MLKIYWLRPKITIIYSTKKPDKWKKHSVSIFVLTTVFEKMCPNLIWDVLSYLSRKKGISETFLSLGLFISRPRPTASASKMRPRLQKTFPRFPFFYFGNFGQISNQTWTNFSSDVVSTKIETKYYSFELFSGSISFFFLVGSVKIQLTYKRWYLIGFFKYFLYWILLC